MKGEKYILEVDGLTVAYGDQTVLNGFSMSLERGEIVAVTGASGSGKSSLIRAVLGFVPLRDGEIYLEGVPVKSGNMSVLRRRVAYLPQDLSFSYEWVDEALKMPFSFKCNKGRMVTPEMWADCFLRLGLDCGIMDKRMSEISGGQRQRVMLAVADMLDRDIVLLDEPTSALDAESVNLVVDFLKSMSSRGKGVIVVTHDKALVSQCDRVINISTL